MSEKFWMSIHAWLTVVLLGGAPYAVGEVFTYEFAVTMFSGPLEDQQFTGTLSYDSTTGVEGRNVDLPLTSFDFHVGSGDVHGGGREGRASSQCGWESPAGLGSKLARGGRTNDSPTEPSNAWSLQFAFLENILAGSSQPELDGAWAFFRDSTDGGGGWFGTVTMEIGP